MYFELAVKLVNSRLNIANIKWVLSPQIKAQVFKMKDHINDIFTFYLAWCGLTVLISHILGFFCFFQCSLPFIHVSHAHEWACTHLHTNTATRGWSVDQWTSSPASLHMLGFILHSLLSQPLLLLSSQRQQERHKGCLCCEPAASLPRVPSSDCQWDTRPDLSTCTDVDELRHCVDFFFFFLSV